MPTLAKLVFRYRNILAGLPLLYPLASPRSCHDARMWTSSLMLCLLGIGARGWSVCHCNYAQGRAKTLATTGPYSCLRNPLYIGNLLVLAGATVASGMVWLMPLGTTWALAVYQVTIQHEESRLVERYGELYEEYRRAVPRWIPRLSKPVAMSDLDLARLFRAAIAQSPAMLLLLPFAIKAALLSGILS